MFPLCRRFYRLSRTTSLLAPEVWRLRYARSLRLWRERFVARRAEALALYDERFCPNVEIFLAMCNYQNYGVFQLQIVKR
jgi:cyclopropane-fatty-acyl-phospholipid synthase